jgi:hypothetical protein
VHDRVKGSKDIHDSVKATQHHIYPVKKQHHTITNSYSIRPERPPLTGDSTALPNRVAQRMVVRKNYLAVNL